MRPPRRSVVGAFARLGGDGIRVLLGLFPGQFLIGFGGLRLNAEDMLSRLIGDRFYLQDEFLARLDS